MTGSIKVCKQQVRREVVSNREVKYGRGRGPEVERNVATLANRVSIGLIRSPDWRAEAEIG